MLSSARWVSAVLTFARGAVPIFADVLTFLLLCFRSPAAVAAENLFLRKQLGLYIERKIKPRRATNSIRFTLAHLSRFFDREGVPPDEETREMGKRKTNGVGSAPRLDLSLNVEAELFAEEQILGGNSSR